MADSTVSQDIAQHLASASDRGAIVVNPDPQTKEEQPAPRGEVEAPNHTASVDNVVKETTSDEVRKTVDPLSASARDSTYVPTGFQIQKVALDDVGKLKVAVIGAGISGVNAGILLPAKVPGIELTIFEKNADVGGTWLENIYPGVRCDIPAHVYQSSYAPNTQWSQEYAEGAEIRDYWQGVARKYDVYKYIQFRQAIRKAEWDDTDAKWNLTIENLSTGQVHHARFDVLVPAIGVFNAWRLPDYPGIEKYKGHLRHTSNWDPNFDPKDKRVAIIGNGASGIQVLPPVQKLAKHVDHYARSKTWIAGSFGTEKRRDEPAYFSTETLKSFEDPATYYDFRKKLESSFYRNFFRIFPDTEQHKAAKAGYVEIIGQRLQKRPELLKDFIPDFPPFCRRPTPGPGYLEALTEENVDYITTPIQRFTEIGIVTVDGVEREVDAVLCATGHNTDFAPPFSIVANGIDLKDAWKPGGTYGSPYTYFGIGAPSFPNLFFLLGPNSFGLSGALGTSLETVVTYIAKVLRKISTQGIKTITPSKAATDDFTEYIDAFFAQTVLTGDCSSWYNGGKPGNRIHGPWPGSAHHATQIRQDPRWEDYEYTYRSAQKNRFAWFGGGYTKRDVNHESADLTPYLRQDTENLDLRTYHELWYEYL